MQKANRALRNVMTSRNVRRKRRKRVRGIVLLFCAALVAGIVIGGANFYMVRAATPYILTPEQAAQQQGVDCILALGAKVMPGGAPSHMLEDRCRRAAELYHAKAAPKIIMSGDHGQIEYDEVTCMKQEAVNRDVPSSAVFMDHAGFSTYESMYRARDVFGVKKVIVVTQKYHLFRAVYIARSLGLDAYGVAADYRTYATQQKNNTREAAARIKDLFTCVIFPQPKYLGDPISLKLNGDATNDKGVVFVKQ